MKQFFFFKRSIVLSFFFLFLCFIFQDPKLEISSPDQSKKQSSEVVNAKLSGECNQKKCNAISLICYIDNENIQQRFSQGKGGFRRYDTDRTGRKQMATLFFNWSTKNHYRPRRAHNWRAVCVWIECLTELAHSFEQLPTRVRTMALIYKLKIEMPYSHYVNTMHFDLDFN